MSPYFTRKVEPGLDGLPRRGRGRVPAARPAARSSALFISAGSGVTPIWACCASSSAAARSTTCIHVHCAREPDQVIFGDDLRRMNAQYDGYTLHRAPDRPGAAPDTGEASTRSARTGASARRSCPGPRGLMDVLEEHWKAEGDPRAPATWSASSRSSARGDAEVGSGGTVRFRVTDVEATCDVGVSILVGGEEAGALLPFGCRLGICHTCVGQAALRPGPRPAHRRGARRARARPSAPASTPPRATSRSSCEERPCQLSTAAYTSADPNHPLHRLTPGADRRDRRGVPGDPRRGPRRPRRARRRLHPQPHPVPPPPRRAVADRADGLALPAGLGARDRPACRWRRSSRTWRSATTSCTASGTG